SSGKTTLARLLQTQGAVALHANAIAARLMHPRRKVGRKIIERFGQDIVKEGRIDRAALQAKVIQEGPAGREALEAILHPAVIGNLKERLRRLRKRDNISLVAIDMDLALAGEKGAQDLADTLVVVTVPPEIQRKRLQEEFGWSEEVTQSHLDAQPDPSVKLVQADYVIDNSGDPDALREETQRLWNNLVEHRSFQLTEYRAVQLFQQIKSAAANGQITVPEDLGDAEALEKASDWLDTHDWIRSAQPDGHVLNVVRQDGTVVQLLLPPPPVTGGAEGNGDSPHFQEDAISEHASPEIETSPFSMPQPPRQASPGPVGDLPPPFGESDTTTRPERAPGALPDHLGSMHFYRDPTSTTQEPPTYGVWSTGKRSEQPASRRIRITKEMRGRLLETSLLAAQRRRTEELGFVPTPRQRKVLQALLEGRSTEDIAKLLGPGVKYDAVRSMLGRIYKKLGVTGRDEAALLAVMLGWVTSFHVNVRPGERRHSLSHYHREFLLDAAGGRAATDLARKYPGVELRNIYRLLGVQAQFGVSAKALAVVLGLGVPSEEDIILQGLLDEESWEQIARRLGRTTYSVRNFKHTGLYRRLGAHSQHEAVRIALEQGLLHLREPFPPAWIIKPWLSDQEWEVFQAVAEGRSFPEIANSGMLGPNATEGLVITVSGHIMRKMRAHGIQVKSLHGAAIKAWHMQEHALSDAQRALLKAAVELGVPVRYEPQSQRMPQDEILWAGNNKKYPWKLRRMTSGTSRIDTMLEFRPDLPESLRTTTPYQAAVIPTGLVHLERKNGNGQPTLRVTLDLVRPIWTLSPSAWQDSLQSLSTDLRYYYNRMAIGERRELMFTVRAYALDPVAWGGAHAPYSWRTEEEGVENVRAVVVHHYPEMWRAYELLRELEPENIGTRRALMTEIRATLDAITTSDFRRLGLRGVVEHIEHSPYFAPVVGLTRHQVALRKAFPLAYQTTEGHVEHLDGVAWWPAGAAVVPALMGAIVGLPMWALVLLGSVGGLPAAYLVLNGLATVFRVVSDWAWVQWRYWRGRRGKDQLATQLLFVQDITDLRGHPLLERRLLRQVDPSFREEISRGRSQTGRAIVARFDRPTLDPRTFWVVRSKGGDIEVNLATLPLLPEWFGLGTERQRWEYKRVRTEHYLYHHSPTWQKLVRGRLLWLADLINLVRDTPTRPLWHWINRDTFQPSHRGQQLIEREAWLSRGDDVMEWRDAAGELVTVRRISPEEQQQLVAEQVHGDILREWREIEEELGSGRETTHLRSLGHTPEYRLIMERRGKVIGYADALLSIENGKNVMGPTYYYLTDEPAQRRHWLLEHLLGRVSYRGRGYSDMLREGVRQLGRELGATSMRAVVPRAFEIHVRDGQLTSVRAHEPGPGEVGGYPSYRSVLRYGGQMDAILRVEPTGRQTYLIDVVMRSSLGDEEGELRSESEDLAALEANARLWLAAAFIEKIARRPFHPVHWPKGVPHDEQVNMSRIRSFRYLRPKDLERMITFYGPLALAERSGGWHPYALLWEFWRQGFVQQFMHLEWPQYVGIVRSWNRNAAAQLERDRAEGVLRALQQTEAIMAKAPQASPRAVFLSQLPFDARDDFERLAAHLAEPDVSGFGHAYEQAHVAQRHHLSPEEMQRIVELLLTESQTPRSPPSVSGTESSPAQGPSPSPPNDIHEPFSDLRDSAEDQHPRAPQDRGVHFYRGPEDDEPPAGLPAAPKDDERRAAQAGRAAEGERIVTRGRPVNRTKAEVEAILDARSPQDAAQRLGVSRQTLYNFLRHYELPSP
ncbi:MAG: dephospho-CoA kinase, partial [Candidatus Omnitrophota bacterium]|nr:dephospho-CoA kinase [Candidatus Omnitrophota bacterium]